jgi:hypothetical protein
MPFRALALFLLVTCCFASSVAGEGVIELTSSNFDSSIKDGNRWLVEFHGKQSDAFEIKALFPA